MTPAEWVNLQNGLAGVYGPVLQVWVVLLLAGTLLALMMSGVTFIIHQYGKRKD